MFCDCIAKSRDQMKLITPEISWHNRDPIYSIDFQYKNDDVTRLVTSGTDKNIRIWSIVSGEDGKLNIEFLSNLDRHSRAVNVVRFSNDGDTLASAGDDSVIMLWKLQPTVSQSAATLFDDDQSDNKETWTVQKTLRGHLEDIYDLCWSPDGARMITGSVDNSAIIWDVAKGRPIVFLKESTSFIQGVTWDPMNQYVATLSCDRRLRIYSATTHQCLHTVHKMALPAADNQQTTLDTKPRTFKMFHDDTMKSFFRRLAFSPEGEILITPAGLVETGEKEKCDDVIRHDDVIVVKETKDVKLDVNATFLFSRTKMTKPAAYLPYPPKATVAVRCCPLLFELRPVPRLYRDNQADRADQADRDNQADQADPENVKAWEKFETLFCLPYRVVFAVATEDCLLLYDSQQTLPLGSVSRIHYHQLSDLAWSRDGSLLVVASTDGYCSVVSFHEGELGTPYLPPTLPIQNDVEMFEINASSIPPPVTSPTERGDVTTSGTNMTSSSEPSSVTIDLTKSGEETMDLHLELDDSCDEINKEAPPPADVVEIRDSVNSGTAQPPPQVIAQPPPQVIAQPPPQVIAQPPPQVIAQPPPQVTPRRIALTTLITGP